MGSILQFAMFTIIIQVPNEGSDKPVRTPSLSPNNIPAHTHTMDDAKDIYQPLGIYPGMIAAHAR